MPAALSGYAGAMAPPRPYLPVLARTDDWVVVGKPPRLMVHRPRDDRTQDRWFALQLVRDQVGRRVYPVHRLDRPASGCLLFALSSEWARRLQAAMSSAQAHKTYLAFVRGVMREPGPVVVDNPMQDDHGVLREARSVVQRVAFSHHPRCSLLQIQPTTGRLHQVRRHVRDLGHPILGDRQHGDTRVNRAWREEWDLPRLGLHCLSLDLPLDDGRLQVTCPVPTPLADLWRRMPWWPAAVERLPELEIPWPSP